MCDVVGGNASAASWCCFGQQLLGHDLWFSLISSVVRYVHVSGFLTVSMNVFCFCTSNSFRLSFSTVTLYEIFLPPLFIFRYFEEKNCVVKLKKSYRLKTKIKSKKLYIFLQIYIKKININLKKLQHYIKLEVQFKENIHL